VSQDLRDFLKELDENGEISHVSEKVKRDYEISTFMMELEKKYNVHKRLDTEFKK
jgi:3-polyprenyl-4-hydroxybenzoate decarboxylase